MTDTQLPAGIIPTERLLTAAEFHRLADVPPEIEWFANIRNRSTRRAYENAIGDFMRFTGIARPDEFRTVTRAHVIAWRDDLARRDELERRHGPPPPRGAVLAVRVSLRKKRRHPQPGQRRQAAQGRERRRQDAGARRPPGPRSARGPRQGHRGRQGNRQGKARPRHPVDAAVSRAAARGAVQAQGQGLQEHAAGRAAPEGRRQGREDAVSAAASRHQRARSTITSTPPGTARTRTARCSGRSRTTAPAASTRR